MNSHTKILQPTLLNRNKREHGWLLRKCLDLSLVGLLSRLSRCKGGIEVFTSLIWDEYSGRYHLIKRCTMSIEEDPDPWGTAKHDAQRSSH